MEVNSNLYSLEDILCKNNSSTFISELNISDKINSISKSTSATSK